MKKLFLFLLWFVFFALIFAFLGGLMSGLSDKLLFDNADVGIAISLVLAFSISALGVSKNLLPGTQEKSS